MSGSKSIIIVAALCCASALAQVPTTVPYQGRVVDNGTNFNGTGYFKFALMGPNGVTFWSNDGQPTPAASVPLPVNRGLFAVQLGDTNLGMSAVSSAIFTNSLTLRVWFSDGGSFQQMSPDQAMGAVPYAMVANRLGNGADLSINSYSVIPQFVTISPAGILPSASYLQIAGQSDMQLITNLPQIGCGSPGQVLRLQGTSDSNRVLLVDGGGLKLEHGVNFCLGRLDTIAFVFDNITTNWVEVERKNNSQ